MSFARTDPGVVECAHRPQAARVDFLHDLAGAALDARIDAVAADQLFGHVAIVAEPVKASVDGAALQFGALSIVSGLKFLG
jgi:hypothetical protein